MSLANTALDNLAPHHLSELFANAVAEGRHLEYKELIGATDADRREFLADISSLANAGGGDLVVGVVAPKGVPERYAAIGTEQTDAEILRIESMIRDGIEPRIPGIRTRPVAASDGSGEILVIRVPQSFAAPHMVVFGNLSRFYSRNSAGKYQLDVGEIRNAFALSDSVRTSLSRWRADRLARISARETPVLLAPNAMTVLHTIPVVSADQIQRIDVSGVAESGTDLRPLYGGGWNSRLNFDGALAYAPHHADPVAISYTQLFRNGAVEGVEAWMLRAGRDDQPHDIPSLLLERTLIQGLRVQFRLLMALEISAPVVVCVALLGVRGLKMAVQPGRYWSFDAYPIDRDDLVIPEIWVDDLNNAPAALLRPAIDAIWQAAGWPRSENYDAEGVWQDR
jgi:hypothetical protein